MEILIIDDEPLVAKTLSRLLRPHQVQITCSYVTALDAACQGNFDLIFCDLMMPEVSGQKLYSMACEKKPSLAKSFVFITGGVSSEDAESFLAENSVRVLYKPFDRTVLRQILENAEASA